MSVERSIAIFSPGLLGGSLAKTIQQRMPGLEVRVWARRDEAVGGGQESASWGHRQHWGLRGHTGCFSRSSVHADPAHAGHRVADGGLRIVG